MLFSANKCILGESLGMNMAEFEREGSLEAVPVSVSVLQCLELAIPVVLGEMLQLASDRTVYRDPGMPVSHHSVERRRVAHLMSLVRLPSRGTAVACIGAGMNLSVGLLGASTFPQSLFLNLCRSSPAAGFLWGVMAMALLFGCVGMNRALFRREHGAKCDAILHSDSVHAWETAGNSLDRERAVARSRQRLCIAIGWVLIYWAVAIAILP